jgi:hypothetical protein
MPETIDDLRAEIRALQRKLNAIARDGDDVAEWYSVADAAKRWNVSVSTVWRFKRAGLIEFRKFAQPHGKNFVSSATVRRGPPHKAEA